jgi:hypothetical protein
MRGCVTSWHGSSGWSSGAICQVIDWGSDRIDLFDEIGVAEALEKALLEREPAKQEQLTRRDGTGSALASAEHLLRQLTSPSAPQLVRPPSSADFHAV